MTKQSLPFLYILAKVEQTWPEYMNKQQAAKYLNISVNTLQNWIADGDIPFVVVGKMVRLNRHQLDACMLKKTLH